MAKVYDPSELPDSDEELEKNPMGASDKDLADAAAFVCALLTTAEIGYAIIGGFGMRIRGFQRPTQDVDIAIEPGTTVQKLREAVGQSSKLPNAVYRILVQVSSGREVQVDLKLASAPESLQGMREVKIFQGREFIVLTAFAAFCSKLKVYANRAEDTDLEDLLELIRNYAAEIKARVEDLDKSDFSFFIENLSKARRDAILKLLGLTEEMFEHRV